MILSISLAGYLFLKYVSDDAESIMLLMLLYMVGVALVVGLGILATWIKYSSTNKQAK